MWLASGIVVLSPSAATTWAGTGIAGSVAVASYTNVASVPRAATAGDGSTVSRDTKSSCPRDSVPANILRWTGQYAELFR